MVLRGARDTVRSLPACNDIHFRCLLRSSIPRHTHTPALPLCRLRLRAPKPPQIQPLSPSASLGARLRRQRLALGLLQKEAAERIRVDRFTYQHWERNRTRPAPWLEGVVARFLGTAHAEGLPTMASPKWGEIIRQYRLERGLTMTELGPRLGVRRDAVRDWETRGRVPQARVRAEIARQLGLAVGALDARVLGSQIRRYRMRKRLTRGAFGALVGAAADTVGRWERGERLPLARILTRILRVVTDDSPAAAGPK